MNMLTPFVLSPLEGIVTAEEFSIRIGVGFLVLVGDRSERSWRSQSVS